MSHLREAVGIYLTDIGQQQAPELGARLAVEKGVDTFRKRLLDEQRFNRRVFSLIIFLLTTLFAVGIYFVLRNRDQSLTAGAFLGAELISFLLVIRWIRQVLLDKVYTDLLIRASNELDTQHLARFVTTWYELTTKAYPQTNDKAKRNRSKRKALQEP